MAPLGRFVVHARKRRGWTRAELARSAGIPYTTLRNIEESKTNVRSSEVHLQAIAHALGETDQERADLFEQLYVLAGYLVVASKDQDDQDRRLLANINAYPHLRRSLEELFRTAESADIDRALTSLEVARTLGIGSRPRGSR